VQVQVQQLIHNAGACGYIRSLMKKIHKAPKQKEMSFVLFSLAQMHLQVLAVVD